MLLLKIVTFTVYLVSCSVIIICISFEFEFRTFFGYYDQCMILLIFVICSVVFIP